MDEGAARPVTGELIPKFSADNLWFVHVGGGAGGSSGIISGWVTGDKGSAMVTTRIGEA